MTAKTLTRDLREEDKTEIEPLIIKTENKDKDKPQRNHNKGELIIELKFI